MAKQLSADYMFECHHCDAPKSKQVMIRESVTQYSQFGDEMYYCTDCHKEWTFMR